MKRSKDQQIVLVVDDIPENIDSLCGILNSDYMTKAATNGEKALEIARTKPQPDIILLDIMMPGMDGYEVCRLLKKDVKTMDIPVIFVTALHETDNEQKGLELGAIDYMTKPVSPAIVRARIKNHLLLKRYQDHLEELVNTRTNELVQANIDLKKEITERTRLESERQSLQVKAMVQNKLATLGILATGIAHEINQPLTYINTILQTTSEKISKDKIIQPDKLAIKFKKAIHQASRIFEITTSLRKVGRADNSEQVQVDLRQIIDESLTLMTQQIKHGNILLNIDIADDLPVIIGNRGKLEQVFINLLQNAIHALEGVEQGQINVNIRAGSGCVHIDFVDNGCGMADDVSEKMFEPFFTTKECGKGTGLGMAIIKDIIDEHHGDIICKSEVDKGTAFMLTLPAEN